MNYPGDLQPSTTEALTLPSGSIVWVPKATPVFMSWQGPPMANTFGGKPALDSFGSPCFAEIVILRRFAQAGWSGRWVETYGAPSMRPRFLTDWAADGLKSAITEAIAEPRVTTLLDAVARANGHTYSGCWDVVAWKGDRVVFVEAKQRNMDRIRSSQLRWIAAALEQGLSEEAFLMVEWCLP
jgi:hypothetical protein